MNSNQEPIEFTLTDLTTFDRSGNLVYRFRLKKTSPFTITEVIDVLKKTHNFQSSSIHNDKKPKISEDDGMIFTYFDRDTDLEKTHQGFINQIINSLWELKPTFIKKITSYSNQDILFERIVNRLTSTLDKNKVPFKKNNQVDWIKDNITSDGRILDFLLNSSKCSYQAKEDYITVSKYSSDVNFPNFIGTTDKVILNIKEVSSVYRKIIDFLNITIFPISLESELHLVLFNDHPDYFRKITHKNNLVSKIISLWSTRVSCQRSKKCNNFFNEILSTPEALKRLDNPLLLKYDQDLVLFKYKVTGTTEDDYIEVNYISDQELSPKKVLRVYERDCNETFTGTCSITDEFISYKRSTFIELKDHKYITRPANYRFKNLLNQLEQDQLKEGK